MTAPATPNTRNRFIPSPLRTAFNSQAFAAGTIGGPTIRPVTSNPKATHQYTAGRPLKASNKQPAVSTYLEQIKCIGNNSTSPFFLPTSMAVKTNPRYWSDHFLSCPISCRCLHRILFVLDTSSPRTAILIHETSASIFAGAKTAHASNGQTSISPGASTECP